MKQPTTEYKSLLTPETVDKCSEIIRAFLAKIKISSRDIVRYVITVEEILLSTLDSEKEPVSVILTTGTKFFRNIITLEIGGKQQNIFIRDENEHSDFADRILSNLGLSPEYSNSGNVNKYTFRIKNKSLNPIITLIITLSAAVITGLIGGIIPQEIKKSIIDIALTPLNDTFFNILGCLAGPMVFLSVAWGIYGIGDAATLKKVGKKILSGYVSTLFAVVVIIGGLCILFFNLNYSENTQGVSEISSIISMLLGIIPKNIFSPFVEGNTLQIIFLAIVIGIVLLFLGQKTNAVAKAVEQINYVVQFIIEFISRLVPYFIFIIIVKMMWSDSLDVFAGIGKLFAIYICSVAVMIVGITSYTAIKNRVNPFSIIKKGLPAFFIAVTTASSAAAFGVNMNACRNQYGISDSISSFGPRLPIVLFKPATALVYITVSLVFAEKYNISVSISWFVLMMLSAGILALSTPPIPGGALTAYTVLFAQLGIPSQALAVVLACDTLFDFISTGCDQFLIPPVLINQTNRIGMVNKNILKANK